MTELGKVFSDLRAIMAPYAAKLALQKDGDTELCIDTKYIQKNRKRLFFGAVQLKKSYVSYHLMPVYVRPDLLNGMSPEQKAGMHGKSCFNFTASDIRLLKELAALTKAGYRSYKDAGYA